MIKDIELYTRIVQHLGTYGFQPKPAAKPGLVRLEQASESHIDTPGGQVAVIERILISFHDNGLIRDAVYFLIPKEVVYENLVTQQIIERHELQELNWETRQMFSKTAGYWLRQYGSQIRVEVPKATTSVLAIEYLLFGRIAHALTFSGFTPVTGLFGDVAFECESGMMNDGLKFIPMKEVVGIELSDQGRITGGSIRLLPKDDGERGRHIYKPLTRSILEKFDVIEWRLRVRELWKVRYESDLKP
jgi:hypothetical protein